MVDSKTSLEFLKQQTISDIAFHKDSTITKNLYNLYFTDFDNIEQALTKYESYKKLEEKIQCPLELVATPFRYSGLRKIWYHKQWCEVVRIVVYEEYTRPYMEVRCSDYKYLKTIFLDDYKNTWWLREDKSE